MTKKRILQLVTERAQKARVVLNMQKAGKTDDYKDGYKIGIAHGVEQALKMLKPKWSEAIGVAYMKGLYDVPVPKKGVREAVKAGKKTAKKKRARRAR